MKLLILMQLFCFVKLETIMINELDKSTTKIDISYSNLKSLKGGNLNNFNKLEELNIEFNNVNYIESKFFSCINLKILKLGNNQLTYINKSIFSTLIKLEYLDLKSNLINAIDSNSFQKLISLKTLNLNDNMIKFFDLQLIQFFFAY